MSHPDCFVYFVRPVGLTGPTKIGSSVSPQKRLAWLADWSPFPLEIVATVRGGATLEHRFHALFASRHSHHEWFDDCEEIAAAVEAIRRGWFDLSVLPTPKRMPAKRGKPTWSPEMRAARSIASRLSHAEKRSGSRAPRTVSEAFDRIYNPLFTYRPCEVERPGDRDLVEAFIAQWPSAARRRVA